MRYKLYKYTFNATDKQIFNNNSDYAHADTMGGLSAEMRHVFYNNLSAYGFNFVRGIDASKIEMTSNNTTISFDYEVTDLSLELFNYIIDISDCVFYEVIDVVSRPLNENNTLFNVACQCKINGFYSLQFMGAFDGAMGEQAEVGRNIIEYNHIRPTRMHKNRVKVNNDGLVTACVYNADSEQPLPPQKTFILDDIDLLQKSTIISLGDAGVLSPSSKLLCSVNEENKPRLVPVLVLSLQRRLETYTADDRFNITSVLDTDGETVLLYGGLSAGVIDTSAKSSTIEQLFCPIYSLDVNLGRTLTAIVNGMDLDVAQWLSNSYIASSIDNYANSIVDVSLIWCEMPDFKTYKKIVKIPQVETLIYESDENITNQASFAWAIAEYYKFTQYIINGADYTGSDLVCFGKEFADLFYSDIEYYPSERYDVVFYSDANAQFNNFDDITKIETKIHTLPYEYYTISDNNGSDITISIDVLEKGGGQVKKRNATGLGTKSSISVKYDDIFTEYCDNKNIYRYNKSSVPYIYDQLSAFLNNEKNAIVQGLGNKIVGRVASGFVDVLTGKPPLPAVAGGVGDILNMGINTEVSIANTMLMLRDADGRYVNNGNDALYNILYLPPHLHNYRMGQHPSIQKELAEYYHEFGYINHSETTIYDIIVKGRETFNYVHTNENALILGDGVSFGAWNKIKSLVDMCNDELKSGVMFWCNQRDAKVRPNIFNIINKEKTNIFVKEY